MEILLNFLIEAIHHIGDAFSCGTRNWEISIYFHFVFLVFWTYSCSSSTEDRKKEIPIQ